MVKFLLLCALAGVLGAIIEKIFNGCQNFLATVMSFLIEGLAFGIILFGIMWLGKSFGFFGSMKILGIHPFLVGFGIGTIREIYLAIRSAI